MRKTLLLGALLSGLAIAAPQADQKGQQQDGRKQAKVTTPQRGADSEAQGCQCPMMQGEQGMMGMSGMGGGGMHGMMMGGGSCGQMMGISDVTVENTPDGAVLRLKAKGQDDVKQVQQMASMMKDCMSSAGAGGK